MTISVGEGYACEAERKAVEQVAALLLPSAPHGAEDEVEPQVLIQGIEAG